MIKTFFFNLWAYHGYVSEELRIWTLQPNCLGPKLAWIPHAYVTLAKFHFSSGPQFPHMHNKDHSVMIS